jgi:hypothetical protein
MIKCILVTNFTNLGKGPLVLPSIFTFYFLTLYLKKIIYKI